MRLVMMGTGSFAKPTFEAILACMYPVVGLVTQPDRAVGHERGSTRQTGKGMKNIAHEHNVPVGQPVSINTPEGIAALQEWRPDLLVVAAYGQILSKDVLAVPKHGGINVHGSLLPKYRGAAPVAWAIANGETRTGVTIIKMSTALDAGDMLAQEEIDILPDETSGELEARLAPLGAKLAAQVIEQIAAGTVQGVKQDKAQMTKAPKLIKEHGLIDWKKSGIEICNHVRAMQPWPTAYTYLHRTGHQPVRIIVNKAICSGTIMGDLKSQSPGHVIADGLAGGRLLVDTGASRAEILELQPAGKRRMTAVEFLRGHPLQPGDRFGPETLNDGS